MQKSRLMSYVREVTGPLTLCMAQIWMTISFALVVSDDRNSSVTGEWVMGNEGWECTKFTA